MYIRRPVFPTSFMFTAVLLLSFETKGRADAAFNPADTEIVRLRIINSMLPPPGNMTARVCEAAERYTTSLSSEGHWTDVNYTTPSGENLERSWWNAAVHLQRVHLVGAGSHVCPDVQSRSRMAAAALLATEYWVRNDYQQSNWWWNWIGVPRATAKALLLLNFTSLAVKELIVSAAPTVLRANYNHPGNPNEATNLVWMSTARVMYGVLSNNTTMVAEASQRIASTVSVDAFGEGLQEDGSWHQHGPQLYSGWGYGAIWTGLMLSVGDALVNTTFAIDAAAEGVEKMILDGQRWMSVGRNFDYSTCGRLMTYFGNTTGPENLNFGHYHYYAAFTPFAMAFPDFPGTLTPLAVVFRGMLSSGWAATFPRSDEILEYATQLSDNSTDSVDISGVGNRHFFNSDYMAHRRAATANRLAFSVSVRMVSNRTVNTECGNQEGKQGRDLASGVTNVYTTGKEFEDVFPVWDWRLIPGTVEFHTPPPQIPVCVLSEVQNVPRRHFVGGVSDGDIGFAAMDYGALEYHGLGQLLLHRSWFMLSGTVVVLGMGNISSPSVYPVATSLDQRLLDGEVTYSASGRTRSIPANSNVSISEVEWLHHGTVAYAFFHGSEPQVAVSTLNHTGSWFDITQGDQTPVSHSVFSAYLDHGILPRSAALSNAYVILPGIDGAASVPLVVEQALQNLTVHNTAQVQFACKLGLDVPGDSVMMVSHWYSGISATGSSAGCWDTELVQGIEGGGAMLMLRRAPKKNSILQIYAANPHAIGGNLVFRVSGQFSGPACVANSNDTTTVSVAIPPNTRPNGQGVSGKTISLQCAPA